MTFTVTSPSQVPDSEALDSLIVEYYGIVLAKLVSAGGPTHLRPEDLMVSFRPNIHSYLPPTGCLTLAHDGTGRLVGCSMLNQVRPDAGELKRLFVRPEMAGHGLGRRILAAQIDAAKNLGWRAILINVIKGNSEMLHVAERAGFRYIERYPECADPAELADFFVYLEYKLG